MGNKTTLLFGIHMHQPVDNFDWVIKHGVEVCYGPFFDVVSQYPQFRFSVHCSGWLMEQIQKKYPKLYAKIVALAHSGSIELVSAGYYEPILSVIPSSDRIAQINKLNESIQTQFGQTPQGLWLTERVWESSLIPNMKKCGINYTVMDDYHFQCAGFDEAVLDGYYMSEEGGHTIGLFPVSKKLRYAIPFMSVESAIGAIKTYTREKDSAAILFDDAEKFGMWPGTYEWVYTKGWLEKFIQAVLADESIQTLHYGEYLAQQKPRGIAYLPNVSYYEMGGWSLRADDALRLETLKDEMGNKRYDEEGVKFLKGGTWKNFFVKYPESNRLHKRMLELSDARESIDNPKFDTALFKLQTNDALWHGVFGGLYLPNLRDNAYCYLIEGENIRYGRKTLISTDMNELDGYKKAKMVTPNLIFRFDSGCGGQLVEFDYRKKCFNWQNTLTRRKEAYHAKFFDPQPIQNEAKEHDGIDTIHHAAVVIDDTLREALVYDWYMKNSFIDHISNEWFNGDNFRACNFPELGDFVNQPFEMKHDTKKVTFSRDGGLYFPHKVNARLDKTFISKPNGLDFEITFVSEAQGSFNYILEHNFHFAQYETLLINGKRLDDNCDYEVGNRMEIVDSHLGVKITMTLSEPFKLYCYPHQTLSQSEHGLELTIQNMSFALVVPFSSSVSLSGSLEIENV